MFNYKKSCKRLFFTMKRFFTNGVDHELKNEPQFLDMVKLYFDEAAKHIDIPRYYIDVIKHAKAVIRFNFPLVRDDGSIEVITAFRSQHSLHYLPTKGGTRYADHIGKII
jgi:glutamate dehydrogenase (NAD(P)+)